MPFGSSTAAMGESFPWSGAMRYRGLITTIVAMSGLFLSSTVFAQAPHVLIADEVYDFGSVKQGVRIKHDFKVRNVGDAPLRISAAELSLPGMQARVVPAVVPPGTEGTVAIEWASVIPHISIELMPAVFLSTYVPDSREIVIPITGTVL